MKLPARRVTSGASLLINALLMFTSVSGVLLLLGGPATGHAQSQSGKVPRKRGQNRSTLPPRADAARAQFRLRTGAPSSTPVNTGPGIVYTCDPSIDALSAGTCNYLNTTVAGYYNQTFTNANASIYITAGTTGLAATSIPYTNLVTYSQYSTAYGNIGNKSSIQTSAQSALANHDFVPYGSSQLWITVALAKALGIDGDIAGGAMGYQTDGSTACALPSTGCYDAVITVTNVPDTFYFDNIGGTEGLNQYDFYGTVQHETDEVLGTASCVDTQTNPLTNDCGTNVPAAVDFFRYSSAGNLVLVSSLSTAPGAYFSYDGGATAGAQGKASQATSYNTLANGDDYADFVSSSPDCGTNEAIQDAEGCPGEDAGQTILNDGGGEVNILTALGFGVPSTSTAPSLTNPTSSPVAGSTPFTWNPGTGSSAFELYIGTTGPGSDDIYKSNKLANTVTSRTVTIPSNGVSLFVRLYYLMGSTWSHNDYTFTEAGTSAPPTLTNPTTFPGGSTDFQWTAGTGPDQFELRVGTTKPGSYDLYNSGFVAKNVTQETVNISTISKVIYVRLYYLMNGTYHWLDYKFAQPL